MPKPLPALLALILLTAHAHAALARSGPGAHREHPEPLPHVDLSVDPDNAELASTLSTMIGLTLGGLAIIAPAVDDDIDEEFAGFGALLCGLSLTLGPSIGFFQADMWSRGGWGALGRGGFMTFGVSFAAFGLFQATFSEDPEDFLFLSLGLSLTSSALIWSFYDLANTDEEIRDNQTLARRAFSLGLAPSTNGAIMTLTFTP